MLEAHDSLSYADIIDAIRRDLGVLEYSDPEAGMIYRHREGLAYIAAFSDDAASILPYIPDKGLAVVHGGETARFMMEEMGCTEAFMYYFNPREGTRAASMDGQIEESVKIRRLERLINEQLERQKRIKEAMLPFSARVVVTGRSRDDESLYLGRSGHNDYFVFSSSALLSEGDMVTVAATDLSGNTFRGHRVD